MKTLLKRVLAVVVLVCAARAWLSDDDAGDIGNQAAQLEIRSLPAEIDVERAPKRIIPARRSISTTDHRYWTIRDLERLWKKAERAKVLAAAVQKQIVAMLRDLAANRSLEKLDREIARRRADAIEKALARAVDAIRIQLEQTGFDTSD
jgi:hypothetical protein